MIALFGASAACGKPYQRDDGFAEDKERYADLIVDPYAARFLDHFLDPRDCHVSASKPDKEEVENSIWYSEQGKKSFPLLLEVLRREEGNLGAIRVDKALARVMRYPGDKTPFVEEVRRRLPHWKNAGFAPKQYNNMVTMSFRLLAEEGDESDIALIQSLFDTDPEHPVYQEQIDRNVNLLRDRIAKIEERPDKRDSDEIDSSSNAESLHDNATNGEQGEGTTTNGLLHTLWLLLVAAFVLPLIIVARRRAKR
jgi:hypothetical protein